MAYRDDEESRKASDAARIAELEGRVFALEAENAELLAGERPIEKLFGKELSVSAVEKTRRVIGKKALPKFMASADGVVGEHGRHTEGDGVGVWRSNQSELSVTVRQEGSALTICVSERIALVTGAMVGGVLGGAGGVGALVTLFWMLAAREPAGLIALPIWWVVVYGIARLVLSAHVRSRQRKVDALASSFATRVHLLPEDASETEEPSSPS